MDRKRKRRLIKRVRDLRKNCRRYLRLQGRRGVHLVEIIITERENLQFFVCLRPAPIGLTDADTAAWLDGFRDATGYEVRLHRRNDEFWLLFWEVNHA